MCVCVMQLRETEKRLEKTRRSLSKSSHYRSQNSLDGEYTV